MGGPYGPPPPPAFESSQKPGLNRVKVSDSSENITFFEVVFERVLVQDVLPLNQILLWYW